MDLVKICEEDKSNPASIYCIIWLPHFRKLPHLTFKVNSFSDFNKIMLSFKQTVHITYYSHTTDLSMNLVKSYYSFYCVVL